MTNTIKPNQRSLDILRLLVENGPLSNSALQILLRPKIERRKLNEALARLRLRGLLSSRYDGVFKNAAIFHQISPRAAAKEAAAIILGIKPEDIRPRFRHQELLHAATCALWAERLKAMFPDAELVRDLDLALHPLAKECLLIRHGDNVDLRPDLMLFFSGENDQTLSIAIECEKTKKTDARLIEKLANYAAQTRVDGVVYFCDGIDIEGRLRELYLAKMPGQVPRIGSYAKKFLMLSQANPSSWEQEPLLASAALEFLSLRDWVSFLRGRRHDANASAKHVGPAIRSRPEKLRDARHST